MKLRSLLTGFFSCTILVSVAQPKQKVLADKIVAVVIKGSPADKAGFKVDDIVIAVGNNLSGNLQAYKTALQNVGAKIKVLIKRNGKLGELELKPIPIY